MVLGVFGGLGVGASIGAFATYLLRQRADRKRVQRERDSLLRLLLAEIEHNREVARTARGEEDRPRQVGSSNLAFMKTETWRATRTRATQLLAGELLTSLEEYYTPLETLLTFLEFEGTNKSAGERWLRVALSQRLGEEKVALDRPTTYALKTLDAQDAVYEQISDQLGQEELVMVDDRRSIWSIWREALAIMLRYPLASIVPAAVLGTLGDAPYFLIKREFVNLPEEILAMLTGSFAFYLYIVYTTYAEEVTVEVQRGGQRITMLGVLGKLRQASSVVPSALVASVAAIAIPLLATPLLVIPGVWLLTRWSLFAPVISKEHLGPVAALKRSSELVGKHFELVLLTAAFGTVFEEAASHAGAVAGLLVTSSYTWGQWLGSSIVTTLVMPWAAFATSVAYMHLRRLSQ
jgi:hypothetical protein